MTAKLAAIAAMALLASGCSSITGTTGQSVSLQTRDKAGAEVPGAACELTNSKGKWFVTTPGSVQVRRSNDDMIVQCTKAGHETGQASVVSDTKGSMFGNIIFGGGIGAIVDHNTGAAYEYPTLIQVVMGVFTKVETPKGGATQTAGNPANPSLAQAPTVSAPASPSPAAQVAPVATDADVALNSPVLNAKLVDLKRLRDANLISEDVYMERQRDILNGH